MRCLEQDEAIGHVIQFVLQVVHLQPRLFRLFLPVELKFPHYQYEQQVPQEVGRGKGLVPVVDQRGSDRQRYKTRTQPVIQGDDHEDDQEVAYVFAYQERVGRVYQIARYGKPAREDEYLSQQYLEADFLGGERGFYFHLTSLFISF